MNNSTIGIKIADGTYRPIIEGESLKKKRLVLTTVHDEQGSVQIDLFLGTGDEFSDPRYVGSLVIEDLMPSGKGEPEIELVVGVDEDGNLNAVAGEIGSGEKQSLSVSLESLDDEGFEAPNFDLDDKDFDVSDFGDIPDFEESSLSDGPVFDDEPVFEEESELGEGSLLDAAMNLDGDTEFGDLTVPEDDDEFGGLPSFDDTALEETTFDEAPSFDEEAESSAQTVFEEEGSDEFGDFPAFTGEPELEESFEDEGFSSSGIDSGFPEQEEEPPVNKKRKNPVAIAAIIIIILLLLAIGAFMLIRGRSHDNVPPLVADNAVTADDTSAEPEPEPEPVKAPEPEPSAEVPEPVAEPVAEPAAESAPAAVSTTEVPAAGRGGGVWYRLKWGDTLWNLSKSFYRTPWLYGLIAVENDIKNPDVIYAGTDLFIPEN